LTYFQNGNNSMAPYIIGALFIVGASMLAGYIGGWYVCAEYMSNKAISQRLNERIGTSADLPDADWD
jgi:hypothetical protein